MPAQKLRLSASPPQGLLLAGPNYEALIAGHRAAWQGPAAPIRHSHYAIGRLGGREANDSPPKASL